MSFLLFPRLFTCDTMGGLDQITLCGKGCPVYCRMFRNISDLYLLGAGRKPSSSVTAQTVSRHGKMSLGMGVRALPLVEKH